MKALQLFISFFNISGCQIKNWLYARKLLTPKKAPFPVISVGNISFGGTGKTPLVINLLSYLIKQGFKPALISRGYRGKWEKEGGVLSDGKNILTSWRSSGDEPFMVAQNTPQAGVFIGKNRLLSCQKAKRMGFELAVLDDGFQHRRLHRDLDIVLYDPAEKTAFREPFSSLKRAQILLIKKGIDPSQKKAKKKGFPEATVFEYSVKNEGFIRCGEKKREPAELFKGKRVLAFCGIARPERFLSFLQEQGIEPLFFFRFPDHYSYPLSSLEKIIAKFRKINGEVIITTEKDTVKIMKNKMFKEIPAYYLKIDLEVEDKFYLVFSQFLLNKV